MTRLELHTSDARISSKKLINSSRPSTIPYMCIYVLACIIHFEEHKFEQVMMILKILKMKKKTTPKKVEEVEKIHICMVNER